MKIGLNATKALKAKYDGLCKRHRQLVTPPNTQTTYIYKYIESAFTCKWTHEKNPYDDVFISIDEYDGQVRGAKAALECFLIDNKTVLDKTETLANALKGAWKSLELHEKASVDMRERATRRKGELSEYMRCVDTIEDLIMEFFKQLAKTNNWRTKMTKKHHLKQLKTRLDTIIRTKVPCVQQFPDKVMDLLGCSDIVAFFFKILNASIIKANDADQSVTLALDLLDTDIDWDMLETQALNFLNINPPKHPAPSIIPSPTRDPTSSLASSPDSSLVSYASRHMSDKHAKRDESTLNAFPMLTNRNAALLGQGQGLDEYEIQAKREALIDALRGIVCPRFEPKDMALQ